MVEVSSTGEVIIKVWEWKSDRSELKSDDQSCPDRRDNDIFE